MSKRKVGDLDDLDKTLINAAMCTDKIRLLLVPDEDKWRLERYSSIVSLVQSVQKLIKHADAPSNETFNSFMNKLFSSSKREVDATDYISKCIDAITSGRCEKLHGWADLFAAFSIIRVMFDSDSGFEKVVDLGIKVERANSDVMIFGSALMRLEATKTMCNDDIQKRCVATFFDSIYARNPAIAKKMKDALDYPPLTANGQTKEGREHEAGLDILRAQKSEDEF
jgi:hypothetical protein